MKTEMKPYLLASSNSLKGIKKAIAEFYSGEEKELREATGGRLKSWSLHRANGETISSVIVRKKGIRFRFETT